MLIRHITGAPPQRATADVDIAVAVADWAGYAALTSSLRPVGNSAHKFLVAGAEVDVVPFGGVESADRTITWPDDHVMNTIGFQESLECAVTVALPGGVGVKVASLPAQAALKLHAWCDRRLSTTRDAIDLRTILLSYSDGPYLDELYDHWGDALALHDFDIQLAGAHRMGIEITETLGAAISETCTDIIGPQHGDDADRLVADMGVSIERNRLLLAALTSGMATP